MQAIERTSAASRGAIEQPGLRAPQGSGPARGRGQRSPSTPAARRGTQSSDQKVLDTLYSYVTDKGPRLCGRVVKVLPKGLAELQAKGKKPDDILGHPVLCVASSTDQTWPLKGGVFNLDDATAYWVRLAPQGSDKLKFSACGLGGWYCPSKGEFAWTKAGD